jgi:hypothetical protein
VPADPEGDRIWLSFRVDARSFGSLADPGVQIEHADGESAEGHAYDDGFEDVRLVFPAASGPWTAFLVDELGAGGDENYDYDVLASRSKRPVECRIDEAANDAIADAMPLPDGTCVLGAIETADDEDWYELDVVGAKSTLVIEVVAFAAGSPGDFRVEVRDGTDALVAALATGPGGFEHDPSGEVGSETNQRLFVRMVEETGRSGTAYWYELSVDRY